VESFEREKEIKISPSVESKRSPSDSSAEIESVLAAFATFLRQSSAGVTDNLHRQPSGYSAEPIPTLQDRYKVLVDQIPAVVFMAFLDGGIGEAYVSPHVERVLGFSREEWLDDPIRWYRQIHPDDRNRWSREAAEILLKGNPLKSVYRVIARDEHVVWFHCEARLVRRPDGQPWFIHGVGIDISDLKNAEQALQEERTERERLQKLELERQIAKAQQIESKLAAIVESSEDAIVSKDLNGFITTWNKGAEHIFGYSHEEAVGQHITFIIPPDRREEEREILARVRRGERVDHFRTVRIRKDGMLLDISLTVSPVKDSNGRVIGASKIARDITQQTRIEQALRESEEQFRSMAQTAADAIFQIGESSLVQFANPAAEKIFGYELCELIGKELAILMPDYLRELHRSAIKRYRETGKRHLNWARAEVVGLHKSGQEISLELSLSESSRNGIPLYTGFVRDVTERKRAEEALRRREAQLAAEAEGLAKLNECCSRLWRIRNLEDGLQEMLAGVIELLRSDKGNVQLLDPERRVLTIAVQRGFDQAFLDFFREVSADDDSACGRALRLGSPIVIEDVEADESFAPYRSAARAAHFRSVISAPMIGADGVLIGILSTHFASVHRPSDQDLRRLDLYVRQAADFVQRCTIEEALRQNQEKFRQLAETLDLQVQHRTRELEERNAEVLKQSEELRALSFQLQKTQDDERRHIARELHDSAGQLLAILALNVSQIARDAKLHDARLAESAEEAEAIVQQVTKDIRTTSYLLHPPLLDENGLFSALGWYIEGLEKRSGLQIKLNISEGFGRLPSDLELVLFRLVQECLTNIHMHSGSKSAAIRLDRKPEHISIRVEDQGHGIPREKLAEINDRGSGVGIRGMRERIRQFGGELKIESDSSGTRICATIPIQRKSVSERAADELSLGATH
jgi:PAS domain S-box-containing protein